MIAAAFDFKYKGSERIADNVAHRINVVSSPTEQQRFINHYHDDGEAIFATACLFSPGEMQALIDLSTQEHQTLDEVLRAWEIAEKRAPEGMEYLETITYFMVIGDNFYQIQHPSLTTKGIEE